VTVVDSERLNLRVGGHLPRRLTAKQMMEIFDVSTTRFYELVKIGRFDRFEIRPQIGPKTWSGTLVERYLDCENGSSRFVKK